ncbi:MAG TPA: MYXO-CTERM sorting domain-containing protein [Polyangiaceae bacterium]|jgi:MYXO-CTERM domain-containing protein
MTTTRLSRFAFAPLALLPLLLSGAARAGEPQVFFDQDTGEELVRVENCPASPHRLHGMRCLSSRLVPKSYAEARKIGPFTAPPDAGAGVDAGVDISTCNGNAGGGGSGGGTPKGLGPTQYNKAYKIPSGSLAAGKIVAIVDACAETTVVADLAAYRKQFGLPDLPECGGKDGVAPTSGGTACFGVVSQRGGGDLPLPDNGWASEIALDVDMVSVGCPECSILLVEADSPNSWDLGPAVDQAVTLGASAVSNSYGAIEDPNDPYGTAFSDRSYVKSYQHPGVLIAVASGDASYDNQNWQAPYPGGLPAYEAPGFPSTIPEVLSVGGTNLKTSTSGTRGYTETVWGGSTSGCSTEFAKPAYQNGIDTGGCAMRADVDVTAPGSGVSVYLGGWENGVGGTSCASPFVAALLTHVGLAAAPNDFFYAHPEAFFDLGTGAGTNDTSGSCTGVMCNAGPGWDGPSGLGSPNAQLLAELADGGVIAPVDAGPDATVANDGGSGGSNGGELGGGDGSAGPGPVQDSGPGTGDNGNGGSGNSKGCGCVAAGASSSPAVPGGAALVALGAMLAVRRRRRD